MRKAGGSGSDSNYGHSKARYEASSGALLDSWAVEDLNL